MKGRDIVPRLNHVKSARKANPEAGIKVGDEYWWAAFRSPGRAQGYKRFWKSPPKRSELISSPFYAALAESEDTFNELAAQHDRNDPDLSNVASDLRSVAETIREIASEQEEKLSNMPEGLQQGGTGELLQERASNCESLADSIDSAADELENWSLSDQDYELGARYDAHEKALAEFNQSKRKNKGDPPTLSQDDLDEISRLVDAAIDDQVGGVDFSI